MRNKFYIVLFFLVFAVGASAQQQMNLKIYNMANTPFFTSNEFKSVGVGRHGHVWAGTWNTGLYIFNGTTWRKSLILTNHDINDIKPDKFGNIWIAQSGRNGGQTIGGGINFMPDTLFHDEQYSKTEGLPNRNPKSLYINNRAADNVPPRYIVWSAHMADVTAGNTSPGGIGHGYLNLPFSNKPFYTIDDSIQVSNYGNVNTIAGNANEIWVSVTENFNKSEILVYSITFDTYLRKYNSTNSGLPAGFVGRAMYFDKYGRCWLGTQLHGVYVFTGSTWNKVDVPSILPSNIIINQNAITGDKEGNIYIGTNQGLVMYKDGPLQDAASYTKYTTANGLPSNYVRAIAIDTIGSNPYFRILATDNGMVFWNPDSVVVKAYHLADKAAMSRIQIPYNSNENIRVAADSSSASLFRFDLKDAKQCIIRIKEDVTNANQKQHGYFFDYTRYQDSLLVQYHHPSFPNIPINTFSRKIHFQVYDTVTNRIMFEKAVEITRPPIVFVHGLFSNGNDAFGNFKAKLISEGLYKAGQIVNVNYPADQSFYFTMGKIIAQKNEVLQNTRMAEKILCSKADVGGHSMGGVLLRRYLQSNHYANDINKYVSFNTPHSGSPIPNFVLKHDWTQEIVRTVMGYNPLGGALGDLALNSSEIDLSINGVNLNKNKVPSHLIVTTFNITSVAQALGPNMATAGLMTGFLPAMMLGDAGLSFVNNNLYQGVLHDGAVSEVSQKAGLTSQYYTYVTNQHHSSTGEPHPQVYAKFIEIASSDPDDNSMFTRGGFTPPDIHPPAGYERKKNNPGTLDITSPTTGTTTATGTPLTVNFNYTNVDTIIAVIGSKTNKLHASYIAAPATNLSFNIPNDHIGVDKIMLIGFNSDGFVAMDSIALSVTTNATLESLSTDPATLSIPQNRYGMFNLNGYYSDQRTRNLTGIAGATYTFKRNKATFTSPDIINGLTLGSDTLVITYGGKSTMLPITISDSTNWGMDEGTGVILPLHLSQLTATKKGNDAVIEWSAYDDRDVAKYDVQHSTNGVSFRTISTVAPKGLANQNKYQFTHNLSEAKNFYRVKYTGITGTIGYTNIAMLTTEMQQQLVVKPNPVATTLNLQLTATADEKMTFRVVDATGRLLMMETRSVRKGNNNISFDATTLKTGLYALEAQSTDRKITTTFIKN